MKFHPFKTQIVQEFFWIEMAHRFHTVNSILFLFAATKLIFIWAIKTTSKAPFTGVEEPATLDWTLFYSFDSMTGSSNEGLNEWVAGTNTTKSSITTDHQYEKLWKNNIQVLDFYWEYNRIFLKLKSRSQWHHSKDFLHLCLQQDRANEHTHTARASVHLLRENFFENLSIAFPIRGFLFCMGPPQRTGS